MDTEQLHDGIRGMVPRAKMSPGSRKMRDFYALKTDAPFYLREFSFYVLDRWIREGHISQNTDLDALFGFDEPGLYSLNGAGWCEAAFCPAFEEKILEDRGEYEVVQDFAGRAVLCFKGRRSGFMPEYLDHPVKDRRSWEEKCLWRLNPRDPARLRDLTAAMPAAQAAAARGMVISQRVIGGYMYLRSLIGPLELLYMLYDEPELIHACMAAWLELADAVCACSQQFVTLDELFFGEDICYNHGSLISPAMMEEFLFPYYRQLIASVKSRQLDPARPLHIQLDSDGFVNPVIPLYRELGVDYISPFEAASGCDVVAAGREYPDLLLGGGFDKRILARGKDAIDREIERIMPAMRRRGGYLPTCDHGVPAEVAFTDYLHFRQRLREFS